MDEGVIEEISAEVHSAWMKSKLSNNITTRLFDQTGEELMLPYNQLSETAKELDRVMVRTVFKAIEDMDYWVAPAYNKTRKAI